MLVHKVCSCSALHAGNTAPCREQRNVYDRPKPSPADGTCVDIAIASSFVLRTAGLGRSASSTVLIPCWSRVHRSHIDRLLHLLHLRHLARILRKVKACRPIVIRELVQHRRKHVGLSIPPTIKAHWRRVSAHRMRRQAVGVHLYWLRRGCHRMCLRHPWSCCLSHFPFVVFARPNASA
jgi:hypothetical protein